LARALSEEHLKSANDGIYFFGDVVVVVLVLLPPPHAARQTAAATATAPIATSVVVPSANPAAPDVPAALPGATAPSSVGCVGAFGDVVSGFAVVVEVASGDSIGALGAGAPVASCANAAEVEHTIARLAAIAIHLRDMSESPPFAAIIRFDPKK
jgi:hypothetical protein